ncbi:dihydroorotate dehydrogenase electron transfer subunit [Dysgonomonas sp. PH5-45]|uniref:dihydroorotate dehydrogenase electron transfer subunit n=1 Tax=unclassified Dysgonomonas TaxID=2630389 RepID=UPI002475CEBB|nr:MULTISPECIES: dihydroorotate dehydrogenase electron transfer subunit [unclassified Dysgonomonas]MDH6353950.1 dihydroorotate dehydrogenase electron transfer subunit [Dysgonomonas sp. PH5-45]MDH6386852.1 dihydroorotate dehydrogenase electron transfer subunit [Dysgonomonas sp. PH5-37]
MKKMLDLVVVENNKLNQNYCLLKLSTPDKSVLPEMYPGQFVEIRVVDSPTTFLRRPISVNFVDKLKNELWLLVQVVGDGTRKMSEYKTGTIVNLLLPLGNQFSTPEKHQQELLLVGGGVGTAPMLYLGAILKESGFNPKFLLGARSSKDLLQLDDFAQYGQVYTTTEDGSHGQKGFVTNHSILENIKFDRVYTCGPKPMMMAVANYAHKNQIECEVSLENTMACGFGVCLCCVEDTKHNGNVCVCTEGPVFNIKDLKWIS